MSTSTPVRVFISYSHDSPEHEERVLALSDRLRSDGVDSIIDKYETDVPDGWPVWMEQEIDKADFVLIVCTATYLRRVEKKEEPTKGLGVVWEINAIFNQLYLGRLVNTKFIPVLFDGSSPDNIPKMLKAFNYYQVSSEEGYLFLYRRLTNQPLITKPALGKVRSLPPRAKTEESLPGAFSLEQLSKTMSNPKYADDIFKLDRTYDRSSVINKETVLIVVGSTIIAELFDRAAAELLRDHIDQRGAPYAFRRGIVITYEGWKSEASFIKNNPVIAIGGPVINKLTEEFVNPNPPGGRMPPPGTMLPPGTTYPIPGQGGKTGCFRKNSVNLPQVALWGDTANDTRGAVEHYLNDAKGLSAFLDMCWK
jgi:SEFIR domain